MGGFLRADLSRRSFTYDDDLEGCRCRARGLTQISIFCRVAFRLTSRQFLRSWSDKVNPDVLSACLRHSRGKGIAGVSTSGRSVGANINVSY